MKVCLLVVTSRSVGVCLFVCVFVFVCMCVCVCVHVPKKYPSPWQETLVGGGGCQDAHPWTQFMPGKSKLMSFECLCFNPIGRSP